MGLTERIRAHQARSAAILQPITKATARKEPIPSQSLCRFVIRRNGSFVLNYMTECLSERAGDRRSPSCLLAEATNFDVSVTTRSWALHQPSEASLAYIGTSGWAYSSWNQGSISPIYQKAILFDTLEAVEVKRTSPGKQPLCSPKTDRWCGADFEDFVFSGLKPITHFCADRVGKSRRQSPRLGSTANFR